MIIISMKYQLLAQEVGDLKVLEKLVVFTTFL